MVMIVEPLTEMDFREGSPVKPVNVERLDHDGDDMLLDRCSKVLEPDTVNL